MIGKSLGWEISCNFHRRSNTMWDIRTVISSSLYKNEVQKIFSNSIEESVQCRKFVDSVFRGFQYNIFADNSVVE